MDPPIIGASEASPLMTPKPHFRPDICRYIYMFGTYVLPQISSCSSKDGRPSAAPRQLHFVPRWRAAPRVALCYGATPGQMVVGDK